MPNDRPKLCFIVTEDWFFLSHFRGFARAAQAEGFAVSVICNTGPAAARLRAEGFVVVPLPARRRSLNPLALLGHVLALTRLLRREQADIVHLVALKPILSGGMAARLAGVRGRVVALTGTGFLGVSRSLGARCFRGLLRLIARPLLGGPQTRWLFENRDDPAVFGLSPDAADVLIVGGAGVDPDRLFPQPQPVGGTLRVALVARMLWSKGVDLAIEAVRQARAAGADVSLSLYGAPDPANPRAISAATLAALPADGGIVWHGPTDDVAGVWARHHLCCLPSRGGEGLPRSLLEAAACGRAILTTDVPGCRDLVRDGIEGRIVPPDSVPALAAALQQLAADRAGVAAMGEAARARILAGGFTAAAVDGAVAGLYRALAAELGKPPARTHAPIKPM